MNMQVSFNYYFLSHVFDCLYYITPALKFKKKSLLFSYQYIQIRPGFYTECIMCFDKSYNNNRHKTIALKENGSTVFEPTMI